MDEAANAKPTHDRARTPDFLFLSIQAGVTPMATRRINQRMRVAFAAAQLPHTHSDPDASPPAAYSGVRSHNPRWDLSAWTAPPRVEARDRVWLSETAAAWPRRVTQGQWPRPLSPPSASGRAGRWAGPNFVLTLDLGVGLHTSTLPVSIPVGYIQVQRYRLQTCL
jgi:hypothetical protein